jgi:cyanophycin synthetase
MGEDRHVQAGSKEAMRQLSDQKQNINVQACDEVATNPMHVIDRGVYRGPHLYSLTPMIRIKLDLGTLEEWPSDRLPGFTERLLALLPGLYEHGCSSRERGGFVQRLEQGTWLGHVAEHIALELQTLIGARVTRGKTRSVKGEAGVYNVMLCADSALLSSR